MDAFTMTDTFALTSAVLDPACGVLRESPRPIDLRQQTYDEQFDWRTLFYDVYRVGTDIVFQGPPLFNLLPLLQDSSPFRGQFRRLFPKAKHIGHGKRGEVWLRSAADRLTIDGPLGHHAITVQPNMSDMFAGRRVITTLSKNNDIRWIRDWIQFYAAEHGADGVLFYDNNSTIYDAAELNRELQAAFPSLAVMVVGWNFPYGPGGTDPDDEGRDLPWDSDYCQVGSLQHARFRFLTTAKSALNVDIDEMVVGRDGGSIFAAAEASESGLIKFEGHWICSATRAPIVWEDRRHADFVLQDAELAQTCTAKWCVTPDLRVRHKQTWGVHNMFGSNANAQISDAFAFRHMRAISTNWKVTRARSEIAATDRYRTDQPLADAFARAGLHQTAEVAA